LITGSGQPQITGEIKRHKLPLPSLAEQTKIASFLAAIDRRVGMVARQVEGWQQWKRGLMQGLFTR